MTPHGHCGPVCNTALLDEHKRDAQGVQHDLATTWELAEQECSLQTDATGTRKRLCHADEMMPATRCCGTGCGGRQAENLPPVEAGGESGSSIFFFCSRPALQQQFTLCV